MACSSRGGRAAAPASRTRTGCGSLPWRVGDAVALLAPRRHHPALAAGCDTFSGWSGCSFELARRHRRPSLSSAHRRWTLQGAGWLAARHRQKTAACPVGMKSMASWAHSQRLRWQGQELPQRSLRQLEQQQPPQPQQHRQQQMHPQQQKQHQHQQRSSCTKPRPSFSWTTHLSTKISCSLLRITGATSCECEWTTSLSFSQRQHR